MDGLGFLVAIASFVMVLIALNKNSRLETRLAQLKLQVGQLADEVVRLRRSGVAPAVDTAGAAAEAVATAEVASTTEPGADAAAALTPSTEAGPVEALVAEVEPVAEALHVPPPVATPARDVEQAIAQRWFVWIGGAAIAIGGLLFVKYAYDNQLISPAMQIVLGLLLGALLVIAGELVRRKADPDRGAGHVPAALSAAGIVTAFGSLYAAYALYALVTPGQAFGGLAVVAIGALALSRVQGPFLAALGLIGSYATPALIPSENPSAWGFFAYLLVIVAASFAVLRGRNWWWLAYAALAGAAGWAALWLNGPFVPADALPLGLFAHALWLIAVFGIMGRHILGSDTGELWRPQSLAPQLAIGLAGLAVAAALTMGLVHRTDHATLALAMFFGLAFALVVLAWLKAGLSPLAVAAAVLSFLVVAVWSDVAIHEFAMDERGLWFTVLGPEAQRFLTYALAAGAAFTAVGCLGARLNRAPLAWGLAAGVAAVVFPAGAYARVGALMSENDWGLIGAGFAAVLLATAFLGRARHDERLADVASGFLSAGAALMLLFSLFRWFEDLWLTLAIAGLALFFAVIARPLRVSLTGPIAAALASLTTLRLFVSRELWTEDRTLPLGQHWPIYGYGVPAVAFLAGSRLLRAAGHLRSAITLEGLSLGLVISLVALELRVLIAGGITYDDPQFLEMAAHILTWLGAAYGLMHRQQLFSSFIATWGARLLIAGAGAAILLLSLGVLNPVVTEEPVPGNIAFNALLLAYLAPVVLIGLIARKLEVIGWQALRPAAGAAALLLAFVYLTLETKRVFQGHILVAWSLTDQENYAYSAVWLGFALALFIAGLKLAKQYVRYAGLAVMVIVVLKVFLWDMSSLEGLYRIASFIGLGLCLVGIGWLYQRFVMKPGVAQ